jgi:hypothetical protein
MQANIDPARPQFDDFKALPRDAPVAMINLLRFREQAAYPADHSEAASALTGAQACALYGRDSGPVFRRVGGRTLWSGTPELVLIGAADERWDAAFVASTRPRARSWRWSPTPPIARPSSTARPRSPLPA